MTREEKNKAIDNLNTQQGLPRGRVYRVGDFFSYYNIAIAKNYFLGFLAPYLERL